MAIPKTYWDDNPEDRNFADDFWAWLKGQPLQAWLYFARRANWGQVDGLLLSMVEDPRCDRALASWLFWSADPSHHLGLRRHPAEDTLIGAILRRSENGGFATAQLHYHRVEVATAALRSARVLDGLGGDAPFRIPRPLCASFEGRNPDLPSYDEQTERDLTEMFEYLNGCLPRRDEDSYEWQRKGGNWWYEPALELPEKPTVSGQISDVAAIEAVFGPWRPALDRIDSKIANGVPASIERPRKTRKFANFLLANSAGLGLFMLAFNFNSALAPIAALALWIGFMIYKF